MTKDFTLEFAHPSLADFAGELWRCKRGHESPVQMIVLGVHVCLPCIVEDYGCKAVLDAQEVEEKK